MLHRLKIFAQRLAVGAVLLAVGRATAAELPFADAFAARGVITGPGGAGTGSTVSATREPSEPRHGGKRGGASIWVSWIAPANGVATLNTAGSSFDTLLSVYAYERELKGGPSGPPDPLKPFDGLREVAEQDDDHPTPGSTSQVTFGVRAGVHYEIAVDGFGGAAGLVSLTWSLQALAQQVPLILSRNTDRSVRAGETLTLSVDVQSSEAVLVRWYLNDQEIEEHDEATLVIPNFSRANVGEYRLRVRLKDVRDYEIFTAPVEIQINSEGEGGTLARDKLIDALDSALAGEGAPNGAVTRSAVRRDAPLGVTRGFSGTQIFNTVFARRDPAEPVHCGVGGSASYWFAYQPPTDGIAKLDTDGSDFDTVLAVYTFDPPLSGYAGLIPVNCDNNSGANGLTSRLEFSASKARTYLVVVDSANNTRGVAHLNYRLVTEMAPPMVTTRFAADRPVLTFPTALGSRYHLESIPTLGGTNWLSLTILDGTGTPLSFTNPAPPGEAGFFRVRWE